MDIHFQVLIQQAGKGMLPVLHQALVYVCIKVVEELYMVQPSD